MLVLSTLHNLLSQVLCLPHLHTAVLFTPAGQLVSVATDAARPKDEIRVIVGLAGEVWQETRQQGFGMVDSELGRIMVLPVDEAPQELPQSQPPPSPPPQAPEEEDHQPLMLLALNSTTAIDWEELQTKVIGPPYFTSPITPSLIPALQGRILASHLAKPLSRYREYLAIARPVLPASTTTSPPPRS